MNISNMLSEAVLAFTGVWVFWRYFQGLSWYNRILWGLFLMTISMTALVGILKFAGIQRVIPLHYSLETLAGSLGVVCVIVGVWGIILKQQIGQSSFFVTISLGIGLFLLLLLNPTVGAFRAVVPSLGMVIVLLIAFLGVIRRDPRASWIVIAVMILALATRIGRLNNLPIHPIDFYHYTLSLSILCFGKSVKGLRQPM
ncbi:DUF6962 family protein [Larkinella arboricola]|uniref:Uncharacterized protein n=1 Tax=Larkinella arboricola TaxID=643671 RepID=A0A327WS97_LARAB|nr:hypothetical protein [Larkinella arboricola]RAJ95582.1 hypothetical protein LX87_03329 [Larkinella arboricola]